MVTNFRQENATPVGRPVDVLQFGSALLISDDYNGKIYRLDKLS
jgi:glucose/arabinose dehydrogenase